MSTMNIPGFTAENSIYETKGRYRIAVAFDSQNASATVQPADTYECHMMLHKALSAIDAGDIEWAYFWRGAYLGCQDGTEYMGYHPPVR